MNKLVGPWKDKLLPQTRNGKGVDLILDPVGKDYFQSDLDSLSVDGPFSPVFLFAISVCSHHSMAI